MKDEKSNESPDDQASGNDVVCGIMGCKIL